MSTIKECPICLDDVNIKEGLTCKICEYFTCKSCYKEYFNIKHNNDYKIINNIKMECIKCEKLGVICQ